MRRFGLSSISTPNQSLCHQDKPQTKKTGLNRAADSRVTRYKLSLGKELALVESGELLFGKWVSQLRNCYIHNLYEDIHKIYYGRYVDLSCGDGEA